MSSKVKALTMGLFGIGVVASGMIRFFTQEGGHTGLIFGCVMGLLAILAGGLLLKSKRVPGLVLAWLSVAFVGGWFFYEAIIKKGIDIAETRQLVIIVLAVVTAVMLCVPENRATSEQSQ